MLMALLVCPALPSLYSTLYSTFPIFFFAVSREGWAV